MREIALTQGKFVMVDDTDYDFLMQWKWYASRHHHTYYAVRGVFNGKNMGKVMMHREILGLTNPKIYGDHIDRNGLNNQRSNLRIATPSQNNANRIPHVNSTSKYLGVSLCKNTKVWCVRISVNHADKYIGRFKTEEDAARAYDEAANRLHGQFAKVNF